MTRMRRFGPENASKAFTSSSRGQLCSQALWLLMRLLRPFAGELGRSLPAQMAPKAGLEAAASPTWARRCSPAPREASVMHSRPLLHSFRGTAAHVRSQRTLCLGPRGGG